MIIHPNSNSIVRIPQQIWRAAASQHRSRIRDLLQPGLIAQDPSVVSRRGRQQRNIAIDDDSEDDWVAPLNPKHPVYNFLIEYYGLKASKGPRQLSRWSPSLGLLLQEHSRIDSLQELEDASRLLYSEANKAPHNPSKKTSILLEGATGDDFAALLHLRGATVFSPEDTNREQQQQQQQQEGILYSPSDFFGKNDPTRTEESAQSVTAYLWYQAILQQTLSAEPILHCHGLHEWAMQYQPPGAAAPPSAKYQQHLTLRVSRETINAAVERRGVSCTHVDALRFFAPAAAPLNHHGASLERMDQLRLEQPGCVHAHMDLLKMAMKLRPFCDPLLLQRILELALAARRLDVAASPYDATPYGVGVIPIETSEGRLQYRTEQRLLMEEAEPIRQDLLKVFECLLAMGFEESIVRQADLHPRPERFAKAEPGGLPWRKNLISSTRDDTVATS